MGKEVYLKRDILTLLEDHMKKTGCKNYNEEIEDIHKRCSAQ